MQRLSLLLSSALAVSSFVATGCGGASEEEVETGSRSDDPSSHGTTQGSLTSTTTGEVVDSNTATEQTTADQTPDVSTSQESTSSESTSTTSSEEETTEETALIDCDALNHQGNDIGQVPTKKMLRDFEGNEINLHTLCNKPVLLLSGSGLSDDFIADAKAADAMVEEHYSGGEIKVVYMFSALAGENGISVTDYITEVGTWGTGENAGIGDHGVAINDYSREALEHYFGDDIPDDQSRRAMLLKPGFEVAQVLDHRQIDSREFKEKLDALVAGDPIPDDPTPLNCDALAHENRSNLSLAFGVNQVLDKHAMTDVAGNAVNLFEMCNQTLVLLSGSKSNSDFIDDAVAVDLLMEGTYTNGDVKALYMFSPTQTEIDNATTTPLPTNAELVTLSDDWNVNELGNTGHVFNDPSRSHLKFYFGTAVPNDETRRVMFIKPGFEVHTAYETAALIDQIDFEAVINAAKASNTP